VEYKRDLAYKRRYNHAYKRVFGVFDREMGSGKQGELHSCKQIYIQYTSIAMIKAVVVNEF